MKFQANEEKIMKEIAYNEVKPKTIEKALEIAGKPVNKLVDFVKSRDNMYVQKAIDGIESGIIEVMEKTVIASNKLTSDQAVLKEYKKKFDLRLEDVSEIKKHDDLPKMDKVADSFDLSNAIILATEGVVMGAATTLAEGIPFAQVTIPMIVAADVSSSMTFLSRHVGQIATSYGYSSSDITNIPHILAAMLPASATADEGFLFTKLAAINEMRLAGAFMKNGIANLTDEVVAPRLVQLIRFIVQRLSITITEKELGLLVPIAGAALNGSLNVAFQQINHTNAKNYFRKLHLSEKYGEHEVLNFIESEKKKIREAC